MSSPGLTLASEDIAASAAFRHLASIAGIAVDLRYAGTNNFVGRDLYSPFDCAWLHVEAAAALEKAVAWLAAQAPGYTLLVLDALRPQRVQQQLWDALAGTGLQMYLANPARGSIHSYGMALDVTILDPQGRELDMGTGFDDMTDLSHPALEDGFLSAGQLSEQQIGNRRLLRGAMFDAGFVGITTEWWHFDCGDRDRVRSTFQRVL
ncbi:MULTISPECIES: M15 family metallopeptidase [unclassified Massilia]|uniref:M15 family metallopeptidase n=1 Tax=unclassified Massilia TaxID=2609279 RepID=UPI00177E3CB5|nr:MULTISPECIES: M15 family metallopeptidase [unclassified Massilia]MBD8532608.1 M15 family metallopeptidase [Massilia sp. CFBP 13647]MBD8675969.1 M15 family metallopeptidase [Massilia sp. CFBP 13721]